MMKNKIINQNTNSLCRFLFLIVFLWGVVFFCYAQEKNETLFYHYFPDVYGLPSNQITCLHQDKQGFMWIGTKYGLYKYDGYQAKSLKNNHNNPSKLTSNSITCIQDDKDNNIWIGTDKGLNQINLKSGKKRYFHFSDYSNSDIVNCILYTKKNKLWVGTEGGLYQYDAKIDSFILYSNQNRNATVPHAAIKSLIEDHKNCIWIGTWDKGLHRYDPHSNIFYEMPKFNDYNSAQVVFEDSKNQLWVGTWGKGLYRIDNPYETNKPLHFSNFRNNNTHGAIHSDLIYSIGESLTNKYLWVGTSKGLVLANHIKEITEFFCPQSIQGLNAFLFSRGVGSIIRDVDDKMWMYGVTKGIISFSWHQQLFNKHNLNQFNINNNIIRTISSDKQGNLWVGLDSGGFFCKTPYNQQIKTWNDFPELKALAIPSRVNAILQLANGDMLIGTQKDGIIKWERGKQIHIWNTNNSSWLTDNCIYSLHEDDKGNLLIGTWWGLCIKYANGLGTSIQSETMKGINDAHIQQIMRSTDGNIWLSSNNRGLFRLSGNLMHPASLNIKRYETPLNSQMPLSSISKCMEDKHHRIWACSQEAGLLLYNKEKDGFFCMNHAFSIPNDIINSIEEGNEGNLWISSNKELIRITPSNDNRSAILRYFSTDDGLSNDYFGNRLSCVLPNGNLCFGGTDNYLTFQDSKPINIKGEAQTKITDIKIFDISLEDFPLEKRKQISSTLPPYTNHVLLKEEQNNLTFDFSALTFGFPQKIRFSYWMEGYDKDWIFLDAEQHSAYYNNLPAGSYIFHLNAIDTNGEWIFKEKTIQLTILPPVWLSWWAIIIYAIIFMAIIYTIIAYIRNKEIQKHELHLAKLENEKIEELNHKKLQFFTNVTHDLMTPLTIISASVSELEMKEPQNASLFKVIQNNLNRQMRLLQQILEFRKVETGNQHLKVSFDDLAEFCRKEVESIQPLMNKKKLHLSLLCDPERIQAYFDPDKLDKILYNLLSNAAKYNNPMGYVQMTLTLASDKEHVDIFVKDNGLGIPKAKQATLFQRFYEGEHRKFNTYGTGIGLSLTKDLVNLHHGSICVKSTEGQGTTFKVSLPIDISYYKDDEIDNHPFINIQDNENDKISMNKFSTKNPSTLKNSDINPTIRQNGNQTELITLLLVEDNEELLLLMNNLLSRDYHILTAYNGKEALTIIESENVDLIVSDIMMPEMDGLELVKCLRGNLETSHIPIILLTAKQDEKDRAVAYDIGADAFITKPFHLSVLHARIKNLLKKRERAARDFKKKLVVELNDFELTNMDEDFLKRCVACVQKHLSHSDFDQQMFADEIGTSKSTLYKKLKSLTGLNTSAFIRNIRLKAACSIAEQNPSIRISDLAYAVGYNDPKYFSSCFKKDFGMLPSEYIERFLPQKAQQITDDLKQNLS